MRKRLLIIFGALLSLLLIVFGIFSLQRIQQPPIPATPTALPGTPSPVSCNSQNAAYQIEGRHILDSKGHIVIPYGVQLDGILLAQTNWRTDGALTHLTYDQLVAARDFWHSNTVSLQLGSKSLFDQPPFDSTYLATIDRVVNWVNQLKMHIILVLQYQGFGNSYQALPTEDTIHFWNVLSRHFACNSAVFFDIFNEPVPTRLLGGGDTDAVWTLWENGGNINGIMYVGFQHIVDTIRGNGAHNLIFADGLAAGEDIHLLPHHTLRGLNIVYAVHPYFNA
ncbi:MAG: glycoside hydrolase family 5 protein, partial [Chloroflexota bacterium]|nr:glycoside hydrolase family 5 protein [Chloroflexota bacterium]